jgi:hypothetical protein
MFSIQTLQGVLIALIVAVGLAGAVTAAFLAAGIASRRDQERMATAIHPVTGPAQPPTQTDEARELVLR